MELKKYLKELIQSCDINFLIGSGASMPFLSTLGNVEKLIADLEAVTDISDDKRNVVICSIIHNYFSNCIEKNILLVDEGAGDWKSVLEGYKKFLACVNSILMKRRSPLLNKQVDIFTTNVDVFIERAIEELNLEFNDGFMGRMKPRFSLSNYRKSILKTSAHYSKESEIPLFNLFKVHGSISWRLAGNEELLFDGSLSVIREVSSKKIEAPHLVDIVKKITVEGKEKIVPRTCDEMIAAVGEIRHSDAHKLFRESYSLIPMINPNKDKFKFTTLNYTYYEMLRMYSNELEKENALTFVLGFSFADEHIREITLRALNANPTLTLFVFAYDSAAADQIRENLGISAAKYSNVHFVPHDFIGEGPEKKIVPWTLSTITNLFEELATELKKNDK